MKQKSSQFAVLIIAFCLSGCASLTQPGTLGNALTSKIPLSAKATANRNRANEDSLEMLFGMARVAERNEKPQQAAGAYQEILKKHTDHVPSLHRLGVMAAREGKIDEAMDYFLQAVEIGDPSAELLGDIGFTQYLANDLQAAAATLQAAVSKEPHNKRVINNLAIVIGRQQHYGESLDLFRQAGSEAESLAGVAFVQAQNGEVVEAKANYHRSLEADSSLGVAANGLLELDRAEPKAAADSFAEPLEAQLASRASINVSFPGESSREVATEAERDFGKSESSQPKRGVMQSLVAVVRPKQESAKPKLTKPPVIAMPPAEPAKLAVPSEASGLSTAAAEIQFAQTRPQVPSGSSAKIIMTPPVHVPASLPSDQAVWQPPTRPVEHIASQRSQPAPHFAPPARPLPPIVQASPAPSVSAPVIHDVEQAGSSRRQPDALDIYHDSFVRQVGYDEDVPQRR